MEAYAVIDTGGKQYRVEKGVILDVERLDAEAGKKVALDNVLAISDGKKLTVGTPLVSGAEVSVEVLEHYRAPKVVAFKRKRRKGYRKKQGHRQGLTRIKVLDLGGKKKAAPRKKKEESQEAEVKSGS